MTREEWMKRWRWRIAGGFAYGYAAEEKMGPMARGQYQLNLAEEVEKLLAAMYADAQPEAPKPEARNGAAATRKVTP